MDVKCPNCLELFNPNEKDEILISEAIKRKQNFAMVECSKCYKDIPINPCDLLLIINNKKNEEIIYCPKCKEGIITHIMNETENFFGCGECGNIWKDINEIK